MIELFELSVNTSENRIGGFSIGQNRSSVIDGISLDEYLAPSKTPTSLKDNWVTPFLEGTPEGSDYPGISLLHPVFSSLATSTLKTELEANGEILPIQSAVGEYFFYNVTSYVDILDTENSIGLFLGSPPRAVAIEEYALIEKNLSDLNSCIFRMNNNVKPIIVTDRFVDIVLKSGLKGFQFNKIWPLSKGTVLTKVKPIRS